jgi:Tfp pilus assembly protein PilV
MIKRGRIKIKNRRFCSAFGLIEVIVACAILMVVSGASASLGISAVRGNSLAKHRGEAVMLAQQMIEQVRGKRDYIYANWNSNANSPFNWDNFWKNTFPALITGKKCVLINAQGVISEDDKNLSTCEQAGGYFRDLQKESAYDKLSTDCPPSSNSNRNYNPFKNNCSFDFPLQNPTGNTTTVDISSKAYLVTAIVKWREYGQEQTVTLSTLFTDFYPHY